jgi:uncharacterized repeat protein (TIGR01451 family)
MMNGIRTLPISVLLTLMVASGLAAASDEHPEVPSDWWGRVQADIRDSEYEISWQESTVLEDLEAAWQAPNRAQGFRTYFTDAGIRVVPRTEAEPSWEWGLELIGYGRQEQMRAVEAAVLEAEGNRVDYDRGGIVEWYVNDRRGLKQGFTLSAPPDDDSETAFLALSLTGSLSPVISTDGQAIDFRVGSGAYVVHYAELMVTDASGRELPAWFEGFAEAGVRGIRIVFDDSGAAYPVTVDPLATSAAWTVESDQAAANLGKAVATAGDVNGDGYSDVIVGANGYDNGQNGEGRAFVYHGSASGLSATPNWTAEGNQAGSNFSFSVATAGDVNGDGYSDVIIGAHGHDNGEADEGLAFVYHGSASGLSAGPAWWAEADQASARFGICVSTAGDVNGDGYSDVVIGADLYDNGEADEGQVRLFKGSSSGLASTASWTAEADQASAFFGRWVALAGDVNADGYADVLVGAPSYDDPEVDEGAAFVYHGSSSGPSASADWSGQIDQADARLGRTVATAGDVDGDGRSDVIVGATRYTNGETREGGAFVFLGSSGGLSASYAWSAESDQANAEMFAVSTAGDVNGDGYADVVVGAYYYDNGENNEGTAWVYHGSSSGLSTAPDWSAESDQAGATVGWSVATAGDVNGDGYSDVLLGAPTYDNGQNDEGRASVYLGSPAGLSEVEGWTAEGNQADAYLGISVSTAGDVNGDGYADVIIGASEYDGGQENEGAAYVFHGSFAGLSATADWIAEGDQAGALFGSSVATAGDVNADGYSDAIVGAYYYSGPQYREGRAFVFHGSAGGLSTTPDWFAESDQAESLLGFSVSTAGDVNGDGYSDVIVGAHDYSASWYKEGRAYAYFGSATGLSLTANWTAESGQSNASFGYSVSTAGDVNGDGFSDVIVGSYEYDNGEVNKGRAFVYHGAADGLSTATDWTAEADQSAWFGISVSTAGDVNGDGFADVIVGASRYSNGETSEGQAYLYHGASAGLDAAPAWVAESNQVSAYFGRSVSTAGDVNGDGFADVIVGATSYDNGEVNEGRAYIYHGSSAGLSTTPVWIAEGDQTYAYFGFSASTAGDVNGDGYAEVIVGAYNYDNGEDGEGRAWVYYGNNGPGLRLAPQQRRANDVAPLAPLAESDRRDAVRLDMITRSPFGRGLARVEHEVKPLGVLFDATGTNTGVWTDTGIVGHVSSDVVDGLTSGTPYHWRARLRYDPVTLPFQPTGRWLTVPWNGWEETDFRTRLECDLAVSQTDDPDPVLVGAQVTYSVQIDNEGPDDTTVYLGDTLPEGAIYESAVPNQGTCNHSGGIVHCDLGLVANGGVATIDITVTADAPGVTANVVTVNSYGHDLDSSNDTSSEDTTFVGPAIGDLVWEDIDGDGVQDVGEPGMEGVVVAVYDDSDVFVAITLTDSIGLFTVPVTYGESYYARFFPPEGYVLTVQDQGDDSTDSDADPVTWKTELFTLLDPVDTLRWDAGMVPDCVVPDEPVYIYGMTVTDDGNDYPVIHFQDPNQPAHITGYNVYRSDTASPPPGSWPLVASDVIDMDEATPNKQWVDSSGDVSPTGIWYYDVAAYNHRCPAEGPR